jgi:hypothetical protein
MKKRDILISIAIIVAAALFLFSHSRGKGQIKIDAGDADATLRLRRAWFPKDVLIKSGYEPVVTMPARVYRPKRLSISTKQDGDTWLLYCNGPWGKLSKILVKNNDTTVLKLGPPIQIKSVVNHAGSRVFIDFNIIGKAGEHYNGVVMRNNKRIPAPKVKIIDEVGTVLATGNFEYG